MLLLLKDGVDSTESGPPSCGLGEEEEVADGGAVPAIGSCSDSIGKSVVPSWLV